MRASPGSDSTSCKGTIAMSATEAKARRISAHGSSSSDGSLLAM
jgi:hypothetical protein